ncbi:hypothetical protein TIFTF001_012654 [Ficus carica]|uniref:Uncharacterized protein n=1 Tax=Ficus carica TaxID=3494 RepID=A0AA88A0Q2_FICCA|nr:hypothetical protein TIFTF001_012654 [Ficus carica]
MPAGGGDAIPPGRPMSMEQHLLDKGAQMMQSLKPVKQMSQHVCAFAFYSHDMNRQIETHHYITRLNEDFLQCAVYDSDDSHAHLIGVEYIISSRMYENLSFDEQKLWHSHAYEVKSGLWVNPRVPEMLGKKELNNMAKTYGKFWRCASNRCAGADDVAAGGAAGSGEAGAGDEEGRKVQHIHGGAETVEGGDRGARVDQPAGRLLEAARQGLRH